MSVQQKQENVTISPEKWKLLRILGFINNETTYHQEELKSMEQLMNEGYLEADLLYRVMIKLAFLVQELEFRGLRFTNLTFGNVYLYEKNRLEDQPFLKLSDHVESGDSPLERYQKLIGLLGISVSRNQTFDQIVDCLAREHNPEQQVFSGLFYSHTYYLTDEQGQIPIHNQKLVQVNLINKQSFLKHKGEKIIMKMIQEDNPEYQYREISILEKFDSPNLAQLYYYSRGINFMLLFLKFYELTLDKLVVQVPIETPVIFQKIMLEILAATKVLHNLNIIHRDLKPENIMFDTKESLNCVLIDFDRSKSYNTQNLDLDTTYYEGTLNYQPPEGTKSEYQASYDCWQLGLIFFEICSQPYNFRLPTVSLGTNKEDQYNKLFGPEAIENHLKSKSKFQLTQHQKNIIIQFLRYDPTKRMSIDQALTLLK